MQVSSQLLLLLSSSSSSIIITIIVIITIILLLLVRLCETLAVYELPKLLRCNHSCCVATPLLCTATFIFELR